jgi:hypothetical protein
MAISRVIREEIVDQMPEKRLSARFTTFQSAYDEIQDAAFNRRMLTAEYVGRAALAFAVFDSHGEVLWDEIMRREPPITDLVMGGYAKSRIRGREHGDWQIVRLR